MQEHRLQLAVLSGIAACLVAIPALALEMSVPDGWYLEGNVGTSRLSDAGSVKENNGFAYNGNLGYKFMPYAAVEGGYTHYHSTKIVSNGVTVADVGRYSYDIAAKAILPIVDSGFEVFAKLGVQHIRARASDVNPAVTGTFQTSSNATGVYVGLGGQVNVMPELAIVAQWQHAQGNNSTGNEDLFTLGLAFIFV